MDHFYYMVPNHMIYKIDFFVGHPVDFIEMCSTGTTEILQVVFA